MGARGINLNPTKVPQASRLPCELNPTFFQDQTKIPLRGGVDREARRGGFLWNPTSSKSETQNPLAHLTEKRVAQTKVSQASRLPCELNPTFFQEQLKIPLFGGVDREARRGGFLHNPTPGSRAPQQPEVRK